MISYKQGLEFIDWSELFDLYESVGMLRRFIEKREFERIRSAFQKSYKVVTAWDGEIKGCQAPEKGEKGMIKYRSFF